MTFEVYARGWLERQTKYAPYDRLLPTFARNRVPGVGGMGSYFYHSSFNASATSCAMRCLSSSLFACAYRSSAASRRSAACRDHTSNSPLVISPLLIRAKYFCTPAGEPSRHHCFPPCFGSCCLRRSPGRFYLGLPAQDRRNRQRSRPAPAKTSDHSWRSASAQIPFAAPS